MGNLNTAVELMQSGNIELAKEICRQSLLENPNSVSALNLLGAFLNHDGNYEAAIDYLEKAINIDSGRVEIYINLGVAYDGVARLLDAERTYHRGLLLSPNNQKLNFNLAVIYTKQQKYTTALALYKEIIYNFNNLDAYINIIDLLNKMQNHSSAIEYAKEGLKHFPNNFKILCLLGVSYKLNVNSSEHMQQALAVYRNIAKMYPDNYIVWNNLGNTYLALGFFREAVHSLKESLKRNSNDHEVCFNLGNALQQNGELEEAIGYYYQALGLSHDYAPAEFNMGVCSLLLGKYSAGWSGYEKRWQVNGFESVKRFQNIPKWNGISAPEKSIVIWGEQGIGDQMMFASIIPDLIATKMSITLIVEQRLVGILQRSFPDIKVLPFATENVQADFQLPMGSLPYYFRQAFPSDRSNSSYIFPDLDKRSYYAYKYERKFRGKKLIGISWQSGQSRYKQFRSIDLRNFKQLINENPHCQFISMQYKTDIEELAKYYPNDEIYVDPEVRQEFELEDYIAQLTCMDEIISVDNTTVHFAGALGIKTTLLLSKVPEWRWLITGKSCPWYGGVTILRNENNCWQDILQTLNLK